MSDTYVALTQIISDIAGSIVQKTEGENGSKHQKAIRSKSSSNPEKKKDPKRELFAAIRSKNEARLEAVLEAGVDVNEVKTASGESALIAVIENQWLAGLSRLLQAGAQCPPPLKKGAWSLLWRCAVHDFIDGARLLWDRHTEDEQRAAGERFRSYEGFKFLCSKGLESVFSVTQLIFLAEQELANQVGASVNKELLDVVFKSKMLSDFNRGSLWVRLIHQNDMELLDHAGRSGWAPNPDGSCRCMVHNAAGQWGEDFRSFPELVMEASAGVKGMSPMGKMFLTSKRFQEVLNNDSKALKLLANWCEYDRTRIMTLVKAGIDMEKLLGDSGFNPMHCLMLDPVSKKGEFSEEKKLMDLWSICPQWAVQKSTAGETPLELFKACHEKKQGAEGVISQVESIFLHKLIQEKGAVKKESPVRL
jgi:hypothetical protein